ncbi:MAG TPA: beta-ketoacyl synthase N-terminal-like domain-containing protein, partial [Labilithrix sp.]
MTAIVAFGAISALGEGEAALGVRAAERRVARDEELASAGLARPWCARAAIDGEDRATILLARALDACARDLDRALPGWRSKRVGLAIGTSSGGMRAFERDAGFAGTYLGPVLAAARPVAFEPFTLVLGACASGTIALGLAREWLRAGACEIALAGGFDAVSVFVAAGFEALRAVCTERGPRPFRKGRDGLALGEGAAILALANEAPSPIARLDGFGASCDASHLTAPDRTGGGLVRAARAALAEARTDVQLVSAHGTATEFNDASEALAIAEVAPGAVVHALKGAIGHTLGAAGALETLAAAVALRDRVAPPSVGEGEAEVRLLEKSAPLDARAAIKLSSAFGGANAALVVARSDAPAPPARATRATYISRAIAVGIEATDPAALAARTGYAVDRLARADLLVRLVLAAASEVGPLDRATGVVVGHGLATIETNRVYLARIRSAGARRAEPRRFPYTTPNAAAGECAVALGLGGPSFAVGGGPHGGIEALAAASALVAGGVADHIVVVAADEAGPAS